MKIIITIFILAISIFSQTIESKEMNKKSDSSSPSLQLKIEILEKYFCEIPPTLNLRLIYKNLSKKNILLDKFSLLSRKEVTVVDKNGKEYKNSSQPDNLIYYFSDGKKVENNPKSFINKNFAVLAPGESYEIDNVYQLLPFQISGGKYTVKNTYLFSSVLAMKKSMPEGWESLGTLWSEDVMAEPLEFIFEKENKNPNGKCKEIKFESISGCHVLLSGEKKCETLFNK